MLPLNDEIRIHKIDGGELTRVPAFVTWQESRVTFNDVWDSLEEDRVTLQTTKRLTAIIEPIPDLEPDPAEHEVRWGGRRYPLRQVLPRMLDGELHHYTLTMEKGLEE